MLASEHLAGSVGFSVTSGVSSGSSSAGGSQVPAPPAPPLPPSPLGFGGGVQPSGGENPPSGGVQPSSELTSKLPYEGVFLIIYLLEEESNRRDVAQK